MTLFEWLAELERSQLSVIQEKKRIEEMLRSENWADEAEYEKERAPSSHRFTCRTCMGKGKISQTDSKNICPSCGGKGWREDPYKDWLD